MVKLFRKDNKHIVYNDKYKLDKILVYIDKLILRLPDYDHFTLNDELISIKIIIGEVINFSKIRNEIKKRLLELGYLEESSKTDIFTLSELGRSVKSKGGHFKYLKSLEAKKDWNKNVTIILSIFTLLLGFLNYKLNLDKDKSSIEKEQLNKQIDSLKEKIKILESKRGLN